MSSITGSTSPAALDQYSRQVGDSVTMKTMNKALDIQVQTAAALIQSVAQSTPAPSGNLGKHINVKV